LKEAENGINIKYNLKRGKLPIGAWDMFEYLYATPFSSKQ
jgi:hypothetical protein